MSADETFRAARGHLLALRDQQDRACETFRWPDFPHFNWAYDWFDALAEERPDQLALHIVDESGREDRFTFAEMKRRSYQVAAWLNEQGVRPGDKVLLMLGNVAPLWEIMLACVRLRAVMIPTSTLLTADELRDRVARGDVRHAVVESAHTPRFDDVPGDYQRIAVGAPVDGWVSYAGSYRSPETFEPDGPTEKDTPLLYYFTSGTTAKAKLVTHTHQSYPIGHLSTMFWLGLKPGDIHLNISSPGWAKHAWSNFFAPWNAGATVFVLTYQRFEASDALEIIAEHGVTTLCAPPTVWRLLIQENLAKYPVELRELVSAGEPLNPEVIEQVKKAWGLTIRDGYGQTETTALIGNPPGQPLEPGSMGRPLPGYDVVLLDQDGRPADEGEIALALDPRPLGLMLGYADDPERTAQIMQDGYYRTGDVAARDANGYITYIGRADDVFKSSDYRISPFELESALIEHPAVAEAAVVPSPDAVKLAVPKAFVVLRVGHDPDRETARSIFEHARGVLAPFKRIRRLEFAELPKTSSGKIRRVQLRADEAKVRKDSGARRPTEFWEEDF
jgi:acetyl-CoA synthetase